MPFGFWYNKAFKSDSQRLGIFYFIVGFCVYGGMVKFSGSVAHTLMRRYVPEYPTFSRHFTKLDLGSN